MLISSQLRITLLTLLILCVFVQLSIAASGGVAYTYDALGRVLTASYDTGVFVYYAYDANGNRTQQVVNVNTKSLCWNSSVQGNPTTWGAGLWATAASGC